MTAITFQQIISIGLKPLLTWVEGIRIRYELTNANRDAEVLISQIKNDTKALQIVNQRQAELNAELRSFNS